jgi:aspartyl-tRNA(Asn)/glutamyl-tRNA(Gln) amidotransferase subunit A
MSRSDLPAFTIADLQSLIRRKEVSPREVLQSLRTRIETVESKIDAYLSIDFDAAAKEAEKVDVNLPLGGVPIAIKDIINVRGQPCAQPARFRSAKPTWTSSRWVRRPKTRA